MDSTMPRVSSSSNIDSSSSSRRPPPSPVYSSSSSVSAPPTPSAMSSFDTPALDKLIETLFTSSPRNRAAVDAMICILHGIGFEAAFVGYAYSRLAQYISLSRPDVDERLLHSAINFKFHSSHLVNEEAYAGYNRFVSHLLSAHMGYLSEVLTSLVQGFLPDPPTTPGTTFSFSGSTAPPMTKDQREQAHMYIHAVIRSILSNIPMSSTHLSTVLAQVIPSRWQSAPSVALFVKNSLEISNYAPRLRPSIINMILELLVQIDVEMKVETEAESGIVEEDDGFVFKLDLASNPSPATTPVGASSSASAASSSLPSSSDRSFISPPTIVSASSSGPSSFSSAVPIPAKGPAISRISSIRRVGSRSAPPAAPAPAPGVIPIFPLHAATMGGGPGPSGTLASSPRFGLIGSSSSSSGAASSSSHASLGQQQPSESLDYMATRLDQSMDALLSFLDRIAKEQPPAISPPLSSSSGGRSPVSSASSSLSMQNSTDLQAFRLDVFRSLLDAFRKHILTTYRCKYVQFAVFFFANFDARFCKEFIDGLLRTFLDNDDIPDSQLKCINYLSSFVSRASFLPNELIVPVLGSLRQFLENYLARKRPEEVMYPDVQQHTVFYCAFQAICYVISHRHAAIDMKSLDALQLMPIISHPLNPLRVILPSISAEFTRTVHYYVAMDLRPVVERNSRIVLDNSKTMQENGCTLEAFFPFDPYLLRVSSRFIEPIFQKWRGLPVSGDDVGSDGYDDLGRTMSSSLSQSHSSWEGYDDDDDDDRSTVGRQSEAGDDDSDDDDIRSGSSYSDRMQMTPGSYKFESEMHIGFSPGSYPMHSNW